MVVKRIQAADLERPNAASTRGATVAFILTFVARDDAPFLSAYVHAPVLMRATRRRSSIP